MSGFFVFFEDTWLKLALLDATVSLHASYMYRVSCWKVAGCAKGVRKVPLSSFAKCLISRYVRQCRRIPLSLRSHLHYIFSRSQLIPDLEPHPLNSLLCCNRCTVMRKRFCVPRDYSQQSDLLRLPVELLLPV